MLTRLEVRNFKRFRDARIELGGVVVFVGPNNAGKTSALQARALWQLGVRRWLEKRAGKAAPEKRPGVTLNRLDLISVPAPGAILLWRDLHVRSAERENGRQITQNIKIEILVEGVTGGKEWRCGLEFDYANEESFYCRPIRLEDGARMPVPEEAGKVTMAFLPPMSGLAANEARLDPGTIQVRIGEGRTAEVLRNLCYQAHQSGPENWNRLVTQIDSLFGVTLQPPIYLSERGEVFLRYKERSGIELDLSSSGRGLQQTLLLLAYLQANPGAVLLLDEPDAHLEILRQREIYQLLTTVAQEQGSQVIAASHSEVLLNEAVDRDVVVAFVGMPHRIDDHGSQVLKALREIGFEHYYLAEETGWVLYVERSNDLAVLKAFAKKLKHEAALLLERPFVHYVGNQPSGAERHFFGLREAKPDLVGFALFDNLQQTIELRPSLQTHMWSRREIENYLCQPEALIDYAQSLADGPGPLFETAGRNQYRSVMEECIRDHAIPAALKNPDDLWWSTVKASDEFLDRVFEKFFSKLGTPNLMRKTSYHRLAEFVPERLIATEVSDVLDGIVTVAADAKPRTEDAPASS